MQRERFSKCFPTRLLCSGSRYFSNLEIVFDNALNFKTRISGISRACYGYTRDMRRIRLFLTPSVAKTIAISLIGGKLDYCNSLLFNGQMSTKNGIMTQNIVNVSVLSLLNLQNTNR